MPEIKNTFSQGKMNKDLDERIVPNGQYRDAVNIQVSTSEASDVGTVQNILGNTLITSESSFGDGYECVGSVTDEKNDALYSFITDDSNSIIVEYKKDPISGTITESPVLVDIGNNFLKFEENEIITGINILDGLLLWTDGVNEPKKINIDRCKAGSAGFSTTSQLVVNGINTGVDITEEYITAIKKTPLRPLGIKVNSALSTDKDPLFEKIFPRFSYRYRYVDGEYSAFAPFTDVVFNSEYSLDQNNSTLYDENTSYDTKEPYNSGMVNMIESIELCDFISPTIPRDVVQVDLLYKQEDSNVVYVLEIIKDIDEEWNLDGSNQGTAFSSGYKGKFVVKSENIYAAVPTNQLLRGWDAVPKKAKAQEVTGNRIVYGNYTQSYNLVTDSVSNTPISPKVISNYQLRYPNEEVPYVSGGLPSVKSQRNYQLGIVYGDKYGRETPVFTSSDSSLVIPWDDTGLPISITPNGEDLPLASFSLQLNASIDSSHPDWADYYKFFIKETSGEYYNLVMGAMFNTTKSDLRSDDHVWISFASSDRNKISKDDYIILKKKTESSEQVTEENKFRVLDVKNEAPEAIKYRYEVLGEISDDEDGGSNVLSSNIFTNLDKRPFTTADNPDPIKLEIDKSDWLSYGGSTLIDDKKSLDLYFSFYKTNPDESVSASKKYKITSIIENDISGDFKYQIRLKEKISDADATLAEDNSIAGEFDDALTVKIEKKERKDLESFSGRFFVKLLSNNLIKDELEAMSWLDVDSNYNIIVKKLAFWHSDNVSTNPEDITTDLINNEGTGTQPSSNHPNYVASGTNVTEVEANWQAILDKQTSEGTRWFVDQLYMVAAQTGEYARHATYGWYAGDPNNVGDTYGEENVNTSGYTPPSNYDYRVVNDTAGHIQVYPTDNTIKPTNPKTSIDNDNLINGLEGPVTTTDNHATGIRRWRHVNWDYPTTTSSDSSFNYPNSIGKHIIHVSFLAPGADLHNGTFKCNDADLRLKSANGDNSGDDLLHNNLQGIFGGGVFTSPTTFYPGSEPKNVYAEVLPTYDEDGNTNPHGGFDPVYQSLHDEQWDIPAGSTESLAFVANLQGGNRFKFKDDPNNPPTIYEIISSNKNSPKKIYNHTPWRQIWKSDGSGGVEAIVDGNNNDVSVEGAAIAWADATDNDGKNAAAEAQDLKDKLEEFGKANNRRLVYMIEVDKDPTTQAYNPFDGGANMDSVTPDDIQFISQDFELNSGKISQNPAIWETEPKDNVDLDIYYEAGQAIPINLTIENIELFAPIGCRVEFVYDGGDDWEGWFFTNDYSDITDPIILTGWEIDTEDLPSNFPNWVDGDLRFTMSTYINAFYGGGPLSQIQNYGRVRFIREDGSYTEIDLRDESGTIMTDVITSLSIAYNDPNPKVGLSWYNCFSFGSGIESDRIRDDFNAMTITNGVRANSTLDRPYEEEHRKSGLIYSGIYNSMSSVNSLNEFITAEKITKDLNPTYGSIQKLYSRVVRQSSSLVAFCEDKVVSIISNKNALYNADGNPQIVASDAVLGDANAFVGDYGISQNPESFATESYRAYFTDKQRGAVLRLSMDGLTPISDAGMSDWFKDEFKRDGSHLNIIGSFDNYKNDYNLTFDRGEKTYPESQTITYSEDVKGWVSFKSFIQESGNSMSGDYYTFYNGRCYKHNSNETRNTFYGDFENSSITFLLNESPTIVKNFNTLNYDGDGLSTWNYTDDKYDFTGWFCDSITTDQASGTIEEFIEKEGKWFNYIKGDDNAALDTSAFNFQGIGVGLIQYNQ